MHTHQILAPATFIEFRLRSALGDLHALLGIDVHEEEAVGIENGLCLFHGGRIVGRDAFQQFVPLLRSKRRAEIVPGIQQQPQFGKERLRLDRGGLRDGRVQDERQKKCDAAHGTETPPVRWIGQ